MTGLQVLELGNADIPTPEWVRTPPPDPKPEWLPDYPLAVVRAGIETTKGDAK